MDNDMVKLDVYSEGFSRFITLVMPRKDADEVMANFVNGLDDAYLEMSGRLNDIDSNKVTLVSRKRSIAAMEIMEVNKEF